MSKPILLYSNFCSFCEKFFIIIEKTNLSENFIKICIDKINGKRPEIINKIGIKEVPSLIIDNKVISGKMAFQWLKNSIEHQPQPKNETQGVQPWGGGGVSNGSFLSGNDDNFLIVGNANDTKIFTPDNDQDAVKSKSFTMVSDRLVVNPPSDSKQESSSFDKEYTKYLESRNNI